jgi:hypothetical protein
VQELRRIRDKEEVVLDAATMNEGRPIRIHKLRHPWCQPTRQNLGEEARETVHKADQPEILEVDRPFLLGQQGNQGLIQTLETLVSTKPDLAQGSQHIHFDYWPAMPIELPRKTIRPGGLVGGHDADGRPNLGLRELTLQS